MREPWDPRIWALVCELYILRVICQFVVIVATNKESAHPLNLQGPIEMRCADGGITRLENPKHNFHAGGPEQGPYYVGVQQLGVVTVLPSCTNWRPARITSEEKS